MHALGARQRQDLGQRKVFRVRDAEFVIGVGDDTVLDVQRQAFDYEHAAFVGLCRKHQVTALQDHAGSRHPEHSVGQVGHVLDHHPVDTADYGGRRR